MWVRGMKAKEFIPLTILTCGGCFRPVSTSFKQAVRGPGVLDSRPHSALYKFGFGCGSAALHCNSPTCSQAARIFHNAAERGCPGRSSDSIQRASRFSCATLFVRAAAGTAALRFGCGYAVAIALRLKYGQKNLRR
jgi:hypothetical protein